MKPVSYARHRFPPSVIRHAVWLYLRFTLSLRDVEELPAERWFDVNLRDGPTMGHEVRIDLPPTTFACCRPTSEHVAPRGDDGLDRRPAYVSLACR